MGCIGVMNHGSCYSVIWRASAQFYFIRYTKGRVMQIVCCVSDSAALFFNDRFSFR